MQNKWQSISLRKFTILKKSNEKQIFEDAWLGLGDLSKIIIPSNPMINRVKEDIENPDLHLMRLLRNPRYLGSTCKLLFDIELHPIQVAILQEFWIRSFPMYIASRGWGKSFLLALYCILRCAFLCWVLCNAAGLIVIAAESI